MVVLGELVSGKGGIGLDKDIDVLDKLKWDMR